MTVEAHAARAHQSAPKERSTAVRKLTQLVNRHRYCTSADTIQSAVPLFVPNSGGPSEDLVGLTLQSIEQSVPLLAELAGLTSKRLKVVAAEEFCTAEADQTTRVLAKLFNSYGSDKSEFHNYHLVYGAIAHDIGSIESILEIGLGTNYTDVTSHMGKSGKPGASLRAFRDFASGARIYGADIDRRILFSEERIETFFVDQTDPPTLADLARSVPGELDLIIDDGLHSPNANLAVLLFAVEKIRSGGWFVIEDIPERALPFWKVVDALMPSQFETVAIRCRSAFVYAGRKL